LSLVFDVLGLGAVLLIGTPARAEEPPPLPQPEGVEVLARGPVHEGYAQPVGTQPEPGVIVAKQPPASIEEVPPDQRPEGDNVQWIPGYWAWDDDQGDYLWVSGFWRAPPPGRRWMSGHWQEVDRGWMWVAGFWVPANVDEFHYLPAPPPTVDQGPSTPAPDEDSSYVPGCWVHQETRYLWRPGYWVASYPNWVWIPADYVWTPSGCLFVEGYWDHPLEERGLLFAPVRFDRQWWAGAPRSYVPQYVVYPDFLFGALFVGPAAQHYYFGDYFDEGYEQRGFVAWTDYRLGRDTFDPNFSYYRHQHAAEPRWEPALRDLYRARRSGAVPRPPRTLVQQVQAVRNVTADRSAGAAVHKDINLTHRQNATALAPLKEIHNTPVTHLGSLSQVKESKVNSHVLKLEPVPKEEHARQQQAAAQVRAAASQRHDAEARLLSQGGVPVKHTDPPKAVKLELPKPPPAVATPGPARKVVPAAPVLPKHVEQPIPKYQPRPPPAPPKKK
jgi:WXXGXW repeat (2 copies)